LSIIKAGGRYKLDFIKNNIFKLLSLSASTAIYFSFIFSINNKMINTLLLILIIIATLPLLLEFNKIRVNLNTDMILNLLIRAIYFIFGCIFMVLALYLTSIFAGKLSITLNGIYDIDQKTWLGFIGTCLASILGVASGYLGAVIHEANKK
jgi:hypothetical protein